MNWLWVILGVAALVFIVVLLSTGSKEEAASASGAAALGCGYVILQIFLALVGFYLLFKIGAWLFG